jgi:hypothetical protein
MGRLQVEIRHGHDGGPAQWGAVVALIVLVLFAAAGHREIGAMLHEALTIAAIAAFSAVGLAVLAAAVVIAVRVSRQRRNARDRARWAAWAASLPDGDDPRAVPGYGARPELGPARRPAGTWPLSGKWANIPRDGDDRRRHS